MKSYKYVWFFGLVGTALIIFLPVALFVSGAEPPSNNPWDHVSPTPAPTDHTALVEGPFNSGSEVTAECLTCHETAGQEVMGTVHFTWESEPLMLPGRDELVTVGKKNQLNNFCIGIQGNEASCTKCHAGYGWEDDSFDFNEETNVDCLVCHADANIYTKGPAGEPAEGVDLVASAQSVGRPDRQNCGSCHFNGGGGNAVKHGDLDESLYFPDESVDVHMGRYDFQCVDCHETENHEISGHMISVSPLAKDNLACTNCHNADLHADERITSHVGTVACQTCHIPEGATREATKVAWDWSQAGQDLPEDPHTYLKIKGSFVYEHDLIPTYAWFNGNADRYIVGDMINLVGPTNLTRPLGSIDDPAAQIWPFKVHVALQPYDALYNYLLIPRTSGEGGFWHEFDWDAAFRLNEADTGLAYSGEYGFTETTMHWSLTHLVQPKEYALQCNNCHGENGRMDWEALGYYGDPLYWGGRSQEVGMTETAEGN